MYVCVYVRMYDVCMYVWVKSKSVKSSNKRLIRKISDPNICYEKSFKILFISMWRR